MVNLKRTLSEYPIITVVRSHLLLGKQMKGITVIVGSTISN